MEDDCDDLQASKFVTDTDSTDQDSLDERIDSEQRLRNHQLWASFQNAASCITKLYKDKAQPNPSPWLPFQNAASNLATLYKDCIDSQRRFAKIGYQAGRRRKMREFTKLLKKHKIPNKVLQTLTTAADYSEHTSNLTSTSDSIILSTDESITSSQSSYGNQQHHQQNHNQQQQQQQQLINSTTNVASIMNVNQLNLDCDESPPSQSMMQAQPFNYNTNQLQQHQDQHHHHHQQHLNQDQQILLGNNEDDLFTFQQALAQPAINSGRLKSSSTQHGRRPCSNSSGYLNSNRSIEAKTEEERLLELNQFLSEEYHRHVGSRKRSSSSLGGDAIKRFRE